MLLYVVDRRVSYCCVLLSCCCRHRGIMLLLCVVDTRVERCCFCVLLTRGFYVVVVCC